MIRTSLDQKNTYLANSILAKINPNAEGRAEVNLFISTKELENLDESGDNEDGVITTIQPTDPASAGSGNSNYTSDSMNVISYAENSAQVYADHIMDAYLSYAINSIDFTDLAKKYNTEPMYLKELINIKNIQNDVVSATISVRYIDENGAKEILHTIVDQLKAQKEEIAKTYGSHTVRFENETSATVFDNVMFPWLNSRIQEMNNLMNNQDTFRTAVSSRTSGGSSASTVVSGKSVIKDSVKYAAVGFVGGLLLFGFSALGAFLASSAVAAGIAALFPLPAAHGGGFCAPAGSLPVVTSGLAAPSSQPRTPVVCCESPAASAWGFFFVPRGAALSWEG